MSPASRALVPLALIALLGGACVGGAGGAGSPGRLAEGDDPAPSETSRTTSPDPASSPKAPPPTAARPFVPAPDRGIPRRADRLARLFERVTRALDESVELWVKEGDPSTGRPPRRVVLQALYQQRMYRFLAGRPGLARRTEERLGGRMRALIRANVSAGRSLGSLIKRPVAPDATLAVGPAKPAGRLLRYYRKAERRFGVDWEVLAAINLIESRFGRVKSTSYAGAQGPMQFIPGTWSAYGMGGNVRDDHDAIMGAANYLKASGAPERYRSAVWNYNHSYDYVDAVMAYARRMMRNPREFYVYYNWQVYIRTTAGDKRLTGPGL